MNGDHTKTWAKPNPDDDHILEQPELLPNTAPMLGDECSDHAVEKEFKD